MEDRVMDMVGGEGCVALTAMEECDVDASFENLPCMALIERNGLIVARNALSRRMTGFVAASGLAGSSSARLSDVLLGWYELDETKRRARFDCLALRRHGSAAGVCGGA